MLNVKYRAKKGIKNTFASDGQASDTGEYTIILLFE